MRCDATRRALNDDELVLRITTTVSITGNIIISLRSASCLRGCALRLLGLHHDPFVDDDLLVFVAAAARNRNGNDMTNGVAAMAIASTRISILLNQRTTAINRPTDCCNAMRVPYCPLCSAHRLSVCLLDRTKVGRCTNDGISN